MCTAEYHSQSRKLTSTYSKISLKGTLYSCFIRTWCFLRISWTLFSVVTVKVWFNYRKYQWIWYTMYPVCRVRHNISQHEEQRWKLRCSKWTDVIIYWIYWLWHFLMSDMTRSCKSDDWTLLQVRVQPQLLSWSELSCRWWQERPRRLVAEVIKQHLTLTWDFVSLCVSRHRSALPVCAS